jgi:hypothetical protein
MRFGCLRVVDGAAAFKPAADSGAWTVRVTVRRTVRVTVRMRGAYFAAATVTSAGRSTRSLIR